MSGSTISEIVARAEEFMKSGLIKATRCGPIPKRVRSSSSRGNGQTFVWLCKHVAYDEKKCLFWPFSKNGGYPAAVAYQGLIYKPTRLMCLLANGAPPSAEHQASHTCGRGIHGCIHPGHLKWKTRSEARRDEFRNGHRKSYGHGGKITPVEAKEIRRLGDSKLASEIAKMYGLSTHRIYEILRGNAHVTPRSFCPRGGRFYPRINIGGQGYALGGFATAAQASSAYEAARIRVRLGEPVLLATKEIATADDIQRWYRQPAQSVHFGDREGELVVVVEADQEESTFIMHRALDGLDPRVKKFILVASETGDVSEAAQAAGLNQSQLAMLLPRFWLCFCPA